MGMGHGTLVLRLAYRNSQLGYLQSRHATSDRSTDIRMRVPRSTILFNFRI
jgi:hypothetical protein